MSRLPGALASFPGALAGFPGALAGDDTTGGAGRRPRRPAATGIRLLGLLLLGLLLTAYPLLHLRPVALGGTAPTVPTGADGERAAGRMMSKASSLLAGLERPGDWGEVFSEAEANAWLSIDLPRHAPGFLSRGFSKPEVRFLDGRAAVSSLVHKGPFSARLWAILEVAVRSDNLVAVRIESAGLGMVPVPPGVILRTIAAQSRAAGATAEIRLVDGGPMLLVQLPGTTRTTSGRPSEYHLGGVKLTSGEVVLAGTTRSLPRPSGPPP